MSFKKDFKFMSLAAEQAQKSPCLMKHGCVAVANGKVVGRGFNHYRTAFSDSFEHRCHSCHAEISSLRAALKTNVKPKKIILYVCRVDKRQVLQESRPCVDCMSTIRKLQIKKIVHSSNNGGITVLLPPDYHNDHMTHGYKSLRTSK